VRDSGGVTGRTEMEIRVESWKLKVSAVEDREIRNGWQRGEHLK
jgi:hypothetical protein